MDEVRYKPVDPSLEALVEASADMMPMLSLVYAIRYEREATEADYAELANRISRLQHALMYAPGGSRQGEVDPCWSERGRTGE